MLLSIQLWNDSYQGGVQNYRTAVNYKDLLRSSCQDPFQRYSRRGQGGPYDKWYSVGSAGEDVHCPQCPFGRDTWDWSSETCV